MSDPIRNKKLVDLTAPTPQNTPLSTAPISSHAQEPSVASIREEDTLDRAAAASLLAQNPRLVSMVEERLGTLIGKSSGYIESLPAVVRRRISGLKGLQQQHSKLEVLFQEEVLELEKKYLTKFAPIYEKRSQIINGLGEPTQEEVEAGEPEDDERELDEKSKTEGDGADTKGIPEFWLSAMKNTISLAGLITPHDEAPLRSLVDIRMEYLDKPGFRLVFEFGPNEYFDNKTITKTYYYQEEMGYGGEFIYDYAEGDKINWKPLKDLTTKIEQKKQRNKNTKQTRVIKKTVPVESFFNFFAPPKPSDDGEDDESDIEDRLELDYQIGEDIKEKLIPHAVDWFTGDALQFEELDDLDEEEYDDEDDEDEDMSDDHDEDEDSEEEDDDPKAKKQEAAECKQS